MPLVLTREEDDLKICLHIAPDEDKVIDVESLDHQYPIVEWQSFFLTTKPQYDQSKPENGLWTYTFLVAKELTTSRVNGVNTPGSDENRQLCELMYKIVKVADARVKD
ncbi:hypothetical protein Tco_1137298 [Tanacetum coccineum]